MKSNRLTLVYGFCVRNFTLVRRYPLNFLGMLLTYLLVFFVAFYGGQQIAPEEFGKSMDSFIVGYFILSTTLTAFFALSGMVHDEARYGTLQQLYISRFNLSTVMSSAVFANILISTTLSVVNLVIVLLVAGESLRIDLLTIIPILVLTLLPAIGVSFFLGGFALIYKRIRSLFSIIQFAFLGAIGLALTGKLWARLLPVGQGAWMMRGAMAGGLRFWEFSLVNHAILIGTGLVYLALGYATFHLTQYVARQRGLLDEY